ncbi:MAG: tetratricopeptide repeat protein, partial [Gemmatimonadota bacterium]
WQARAARQEMARADRVKEFLVDLLHQADPNVTQGKEFTVRELLDRGTHRVDSMLGREPRVQAELYELIGNTYAHLGLADQADTLHRKGLAVIRALYGPGDPEVLDQEMAVAWGLNDRGRYRDADSLLTRALASYQAAGGPESQALSDAIDILGTAKKRLDQQAAAESLYRRSLAMQIRLTGASDTITASRLSDLGVLLGGQNRLVPAESALVAAQAHRRGVLDPLDVRYLVGEASLASVMMKRGDLAGAEPRLTTALAGLRQVEKNGDLNLARTLDRMALLQFLQMHVAATIRTGEMAHDMFVTRMGDDHPETLNNLSALAWYRSASGDSNVRKAANLAYEGLRLKLGDRHDWTLLAGQRLCAILLRAGQFAQARSIDDVTLATVRDKYEHLPPAFAGLIATQAQLLEIRGDSSAADTSFREALGSLTGGTRVDSAAYPGILTQYAELLAARGNLQAAGSMLRQALAFFPAGGDSSEVTSVEARRELALVISSATSHPQSRIEPTKAGGPSKPARVPTGVRGN